MTSSVGGITIYVYFSFVRVSSTVASQAVKVEHDHNSNISNSQGTEPPSGLTSTGNFSVSTLFNNHYAVRPPFMGSSWNIFGVPTYLNKDPSSANYLYTRRTQKRHHPFWKMFIFLKNLSYLNGNICIWFLSKLKKKKEFAHFRDERRRFSHNSVIHIYVGVANFTIKARFLVASL